MSKFKIGDKVMKTLQTMITPDYCPDWGRLEAIREWITNALDAGTNYDVSYKEIDSTLTITSFNTKLSVESLLMGYSKNRNKESSVGTHGEGMLVAIAVAKSRGLLVNIVNGADVWVPYFDTIIEGSDTEVLNIGVGNNIYDYLKDDFSVIVQGVTPDEWEQIQERFLPLQDLSNDEILECELGRVFLNRKGKLYVGGVYVKDTELDYTYDFHPKYLPLNRDRMSVDSWDLGTRTAELWKLAAKPEDVADMVYKGSSDLSYMEYAHTTQSKEVDEACFKKYISEFSGKQLVSSSKDKRELESQGFVDVEVVPNSNFVSSVKRTESYSKLTFIKEEYQPIDLLKEALNDAYIQHREGNYTTMLNKLQEVMAKFESRGVRWS